MVIILLIISHVLLLMVTLCLEYPEDDFPVAVTASLKNETAQKMARVGDKWQTVWYTREKSADRIFQKHASFTIVIDFKEPTEKIVDHLTNLFDSQTSTDVKFVVQGREIGAHLCVLSINPVMAAMFDPDKFQEGQTKRVTIEDVSPETFRILLRHLYSGQTPRVEDEFKAEELLKAADKYQISAIKDACEKYLQCHLKSGNAIRLLIFGHLHSASGLMEACLDYLSRHAREVWFRPEWKYISEDYPRLFVEISKYMAYPFAN